MVLVEGWAVGAFEPWTPGGPGPAAPMSHGTFRCQRCGAVFPWRRMGPLRVLGIAALAPAALLWAFGAFVFTAQVIFGDASEAIGALACVGLALAGTVLALASLARPWWTARGWPVVDAPRPLVAFGRSAPAARACRCGAPAPAVRRVPLRLRALIPMGHVHEHACDACKATFNVHDLASVLTSALAASILTAAGATVIAFPPGSAVGATASNRWFGVGLLGIGLLAFAVPATRLAGRLRHPLVRPARF